MEPTCKKSWMKEFPKLKSDNNDLWEHIFSNVYQCCRESKLQTFQYKIINRIITCREKLFQWKIVESSKCPFCDHVDNISHFFVLCKNTDVLWRI